MVFKIKIHFGEGVSTVVLYETEEERNAVFQAIHTADWSKPLLIQCENGGHKRDTIINLSRVCMVYCLNER